MNRRLLIHWLGAILLLEAALMLPSLFVSLYYREAAVQAFLLSIGLLVVVGLPLRLLAKPSLTNLREREGMAIAAFSWFFLMVFGALPYLFGGAIPNVMDALFEAASGFSTTGATVINQLEGVSKGVLFWRSFTHWIGGMGVLVLTLAILPQLTGRTSHLMRAESPGPSLSKLVPKLGDSAKILYIIYCVLTLAQVIALLLVGLSPYDAVIHALSTAGTGGFSNYGDSIGHFNSPAVEMVTAVFMLLFGINFAVYYKLLFGPRRDALKNEELIWFAAISGSAVVTVALLIQPQYGSLGTAFRHSFFQVFSTVSTTGFGTQDYTLWPQAAQAILFLLMFMGSCVGSTAGGLKVVRVALLVKIARREVRQSFQPRKMQVVRFDGKGLEEAMLSHIGIYFFVYFALIVGGTLLVSLENQFDLMTNFSASLTCVSNVGPGFSRLGPAYNFSSYGSFSKGVFSVLMLAGRLELFPVLVMLHPSFWRKQ